MPEYVYRTPLKLFINFNPRLTPEPYEMRTTDQRRRLIHRFNSIDLPHIKQSCLSVNKGLFLAPSQFPNPHSTNGLWAAQDISKHQVITFVEGQALDDDALPPNEVFMLFFEQFHGSPSAGLAHRYLLAGRDQQGTPFSSDSEQVVQVDATRQVIGAGGLAHDCLNVEKYRRLMSAMETEVVVSEKKRDADKEDGEEINKGEERSVDEEEDEQSDIVGGHGPGDEETGVRPLVPDPESADQDEGDATRPAINAVIRIYDDRYNQTIRAVAKTYGYEFLTELKSEHSIVILEALRTIRRGEEIVIKFDEKVWLDYLQGGHQAALLGKQNLAQELNAIELRGAKDQLRQALGKEDRRQAAIKYPLVSLSKVPAYDPEFIDTYEGMHGGPKPAQTAKTHHNGPQEELEELESVEEEGESDYDSDDDSETTAGSFEVEEDSEEDEDEEKEDEDPNFRPRAMRKELESLERRLDPLDVRLVDIPVIRQLLDRIARDEATMSDDEYQAAVIEVLMRQSMLTDEEEVKYFLAESDLNKQSHTVGGKLDTSRESYRQLLELQALRKKIEQLRLSDALKDVDESVEMIAQLRRERKAFVNKLQPADDKKKKEKK